MWGVLKPRQNYCTNSAFINMSVWNGQNCKKLFISATSLYPQYDNLLLLCLSLAVWLPWSMWCNVQFRSELLNENVLTLILFCFSSFCTVVFVDLCDIFKSSIYFSLSFHFVLFVYNVKSCSILRVNGFQVCYVYKCILFILLYMQLYRHTDVLHEVEEWTWSILLFYNVRYTLKFWNLFVVVLLCWYWKPFMICIV